MSEQQNLIVFYILSALTICIGEGISDVSTNGNRNANPCGKGQFYFNANITEGGENVYQRCKLCPVGTYNDQDEDVSQCSPCPEHDRYPVHTSPGADSTTDCVLCAGRCEKNNPSSCYTPEQKCNSVSDCAYGQDETSCDSVESDEETPRSASRYQKYSWFFFIPVPFVICAGFGKLYHTQKNRGLPVNAETGSPIRIHFRPQVSGRSRNRTRRSSNPVTIEMPLISNGNANGSPSNHTQVSRSPSNQSQRTRSSQGSVCLSPSGQHLTVVGDDRSSRRSSATSQRSRSGSHGSRSFSRSPRLGGDGERQRSSTRTVQPAVLVLPNQMPPRHVPLRSSVSLPPFPFPSPMSTISHPAGSPPLPVVLSASPPPPSYEEVVTSSNAYPQHSPPPIDGLPSYEAATRNTLSSTSSA